MIAKDPKHHYHVAEVNYKKQLSRDIATKEKECMEKLVRQRRSLTNSAVATVISDIRKAESTFGIPILPIDNDVVDDEHSVLVTDVNEVCMDGKGDCFIANEHDIKAEPVDETTHRRILFTAAENEKLKEGIERFGPGQGIKMLDFGATTFNKVRTRDSLRMCANTMGFR